MKKMLKRLNKREGFTLAELLIVVAIIAVLVAISIPVFTSQLNKSQLATDTANVRAAYAEAVSLAVADGETNADGKFAINLSKGVAEYSNVTLGTNSIVITHKKDGNLENTFATDEDVVVTLVD